MYADGRLLCTFIFLRFISSVFTFIGLSVLDFIFFDGLDVCVCVCSCLRFNTPPHICLIWIMWSCTSVCVGYKYSQRDAKTTKICQHLMFLWSLSCASGIKLHIYLPNLKRTSFFVFFLFFWFKRKVLEGCAAIVCRYALGPRNQTPLFYFSLPASKDVQ